MNRETIIAIGVGVGFGLIVGLIALFQINKTSETKIIPITKERVVNQKNTPQNNATTKSVNLQIQSPKNNSIVSEKSIQIIGKAQKNSLIVLQSPTTEKAMKIEKENFNIDFSLSMGENIISINAYSDSSTPQEQLMKIYYIPKQ